MKGYSNNYVTNFHYMKLNKIGNQMFRFITERLHLSGEYDSNCSQIYIKKIWIIYGKY